MPPPPDPKARRAAAHRGPRFGAWLDAAWLRWPLRVLFWTYAAYFLLVNVALNTRAPWGFLRPADNSSRITWSWGWSLLPSFATVHNFYLTVEDDNIQLGVRIDRASVRYEPTAFLHRTFHATGVHAEGVSTRLRVKKTAEEIAHASPEDLTSIPTIPGFKDPPLRGPPSPPFQGDRSIYWTIKIDGVSAATREVWIEGARFIGAARAYGSFTFRPLTVVEVNAGLDVHGGDLTLGDNPLSQGLHGGLAVTVDRFDPLPETGLEPLKHIAADLTLDGELHDVALLNPLLRRAKTPNFESSAGHFDLFTRFDRGRFMPESHFAMQASRWAIAEGRYRALGTDTLVEGAISDEPRGPHGVVSIALGPYQVLDPGLREEVFDGDGMILKMTSDRLDLLDRPFEDLGFEVQVAAARIPDLTVLNAYLPRSETFEVLGGRGELTGVFLRPPDGEGDADFDLATKQAAVRIGRAELQGDLVLKAHLAGLASSAREPSILGRGRLEGLGHLAGHFTVADMDAPQDQSSHLLASFATRGEFVLHPLLASEARGAELLRYLSGELELDGSVPGLEFLNGTLRQRGLVLQGGQGDLTIDARLSRGVVGRGTQLDFVSHDIAVAGGELVGRGDLAVHARVEETRETPRMSVVTGMKSMTIGTTALPDFVFVKDLSLTASSPEVDLRALPRLRPTLDLAAQQIILGDLSQLDRWLPGPFQLTRGRAEVGLRGNSPPRGTGTLEATILVSGVRGRAGPLSISGEFGGEARLGGIADQPWTEGLVARSRLEAGAALEGRCHAVADPRSGDAPSTARVRFHARGEIPAIEGAGLTGPELAARATGSVSFTGEVTNLGYVNQFLGKAPVRVEGGSASVAGEVKVARAEMAPGSTVAADAHDLRVSLGPLWLTGPLHVAAKLGPPDTADRAQLQAGMDSFTLENRFEDRVLARGAGLSFALNAPRLSGDGLLLDSRFRGRAEQIALPDLGDLARYLPRTRDFRLLSGSATATATLEHPSRDHGQANVKVTLDRVQVLLSDKPITADVRVDAVLRALATAGSNGKPLLQTLDVADSSVDMSGVDLATGRSADRNWWAKLRVIRGELAFGDGSDSHLTLSGDTAIEARDALPWLHLYGSQMGIPGWLDGLLAFNRLKATAALEVRGNRFALPAFQAEGDHLKLVGRLLLDERHTSGDFLLDVGPFALGLDVRDRHSGVQWLGASGWYQERLAKPLE